MYVHTNTFNNKNLPAAMLNSIKLASSHLKELYYSRVEKFKSFSKTRRQDVSRHRDKMENPLSGAVFHRKSAIIAVAQPFQRFLFELDTGSQRNCIPSTCVRRLRNSAQNVKFHITTDKFSKISPSLALIN